MLLIIEIHSHIKLSFCYGKLDWTFRKGKMTNDTTALGNTRQRESFPEQRLEFPDKFSQPSLGSEQQTCFKIEVTTDEIKRSAGYPARSVLQYGDPVPPPQPPPHRREQQRLKTLLPTSRGPSKTHAMRRVAAALCGHIFLLINESHNAHRKHPWGSNAELYHN